jgi:hypothetical protein
MKQFLKERSYLEEDVSEWNKKKDIEQITVSKRYME